MQDPGYDLSQLQRWLQAVITHPGGARAGIESAAAQEEITVSPGGAEQLVLPSKQLSSLERLSIYADAYYARLIECFHDEYPALRHALGDEAFDAFVLAYLQRYPSQSYTLANLSAAFPQFLAETRSEDDEAETMPWAGFLIELARLERLYIEVFDGPGDEELPPLRAEQLLSIPPERWGEAVLVPAASLRLIRFGWPVHEYVSAVSRGEQPQMPAARPTCLAILRRQYSVRRHLLTDGQHALLEAILAGQPLGPAIEMAASATEEPELFAGELANCFRDWAAAGLFIDVRLPR